MEAVVLQALGNVGGLDSRRVGEGPEVEDELVCAAAVAVRVQDLVVRGEAGEEVVCIKERCVRCLAEAVGAWGC